MANDLIEKVKQIVEAINKSRGKRKVAFEYSEHTEEYDLYIYLRNGNWVWVYIYTDPYWNNTIDPALEYMIQVLEDLKIGRPLKLFNTHMVDIKTIFKNGNLCANLGIQEED